MNSISYNAYEPEPNLPCLKSMILNNDIQYIVLHTFCMFEVNPIKNPDRLKIVELAKILREKLELKTRYLMAHYKKITDFSFQVAIEEDTAHLLIEASNLVALKYRLDRQLKDLARSIFNRIRDNVTIMIAVGNKSSRSVKSGQIDIQALAETFSIDDDLKYRMLSDEFEGTDWTSAEGVSKHADIQKGYDDRIEECLNHFLLDEG